MTEPAPGTVCNIAGRGRARRAAMGVAALSATGAALFLLDARFATPWWRLALVPVLSFAFLCLFQAQGRT